MAGGIHATRVTAGGSVGQGGQHGTLLAASEGTEPLPRQASVLCALALQNRAHKSCCSPPVPCE